MFRGSSTSATIHGIPVWSALHTSLKVLLSALLRHHVRSQNHASVKEEVVEVVISDICVTQRTCSDHFRDGGSLWNLIDGLLSGCFDPLSDDFLILDALQIRLWGRPQRIVYYTLVHRRPKCMIDAGCKRLRIRRAAVSSQM